MTVFLYAGAALLITVGIAHSYLGERYILTRLFRRTDLPRLFGGTEFTARTLRFAWHITSIAWIGFAAVFLLMAHPPVEAEILGAVLGATMLATGIAIFAGSRGRHLAWLVFLVVGIIALCAVGT